MRRTKTCLGIIILIMTIAISVGRSEGERSNPISPLVPHEIQGWKAKGHDAIYNRETIFDYLNGAGEVYRWYDFRQLLVRWFARADQPDIILEMFDMGSSEDAFGIFCHGREEQGEDIGIGQQSEYASGQLFFWQGRFYINIYAMRETPLAKKTVLDLGRTVSMVIGAKGGKPILVSSLPAQGLIKPSIRYFHNHLSLNRYYSFGDKNILHLNHQTKAVLAGYLHNGAKTSLFLIQYLTPQKAKAAFESFVAASMPETRQAAIAQRENGRWSAAKTEDAFVITVFDAPSMAYAEALMNAVMENLEGK